MAESPTTPADPREQPQSVMLRAAERAPKVLPPRIARNIDEELREFVENWDVLQGIHGSLFPRLVDHHLSVAQEVLSLPDTEGIAPLRASGTPGQSVEVVAAEIEAHASQSIPALDLDLIRALASGLSLKEYAAREGLTATTASQRAIRMRQRLGVTSNEQATHEATLRGLLKGVPRP